jgi:uncharacterized membrane protein
MTFLPNNPWLILAVFGGLAYPPIVYFGLSVVPPAVLVLVGLGLIGLRLAGVRRLAQSRAWILAFLLAAIGLVALLALSPRLAAMAYPVAVSLCVAGVFALSVRFPPTVIERFARIVEPDLPPEGVAYTRKVTVVWVIFLLSNAAISAAAALWGSLAQWTLWNGLLSYIAMGLLFGGEFLVRRVIRRRAER